MRLDHPVKPGGREREQLIVFVLVPDFIVRRRLRIDGFDPERGDMAVLRPDEGHVGFHNMRVHAGIRLDFEREAAFVETGGNSQEEVSRHIFGKLETVTPERQFRRRVFACHDDFRPVLGLEVETDLRFSADGHDLHVGARHEPHRLDGSRTGHGKLQDGKQVPEFKFRPFADSDHRERSRTE